MSATPRKVADAVVVCACGRVVSEKIALDLERDLATEIEQHDASMRMANSEIERLQARINQLELESMR